MSDAVILAIITSVTTLLGIVLSKWKGTRENKDIRDAIDEHALSDLDEFKLLHEKLDIVRFDVNSKIDDTFKLGHASGQETERREERERGERR